MELSWVLELCLSSRSSFSLSLEYLFSSLLWLSHCSLAGHDVEEEDERSFWALMSGSASEVPEFGLGWEWAQH